jgi:hypothetical protein
MKIDYILLYYIVEPATAILLKRAGFNALCLGTYDSKGDFRYSLYSGEDHSIFIRNEDIVNTDEAFSLAPTFDQVVDWFQKEHDIYIGKTGYDDGITPKRFVYHVNKQYCTVQSNDGAILDAIKLINNP